MGLTHDFIGFPPIRVSEKDDTITWCPNSCTLASIKGYIQEKANKPHINITDIKSIMKSDASIAFEICLFIHNRILNALTIIGIILIMLMCFIVESNPFLGIGCIGFSTMLLGGFVYIILQQIYNNYNMNFKSKIYEEQQFKRAGKMKYE